MAYGLNVIILKELDMDLKGNGNANAEHADSG